MSKRKWQVYEDDHEDTESPPLKLPRYAFDEYTLEWKNDSVGFPNFTLTAKSEFWTKWSPMVQSMLVNFEGMKKKTIFIENDFGFKIDSTSLNLFIQNFILGRTSCSEMIEFLNGYYDQTMSNEFWFPLIHLVKVSQFFCSEILQNQMIQLINQFINSDKLGCNGHWIVDLIFVHFEHPTWVNLDKLFELGYTVLTFWTPYFEHYLNHDDDLILLVSKHIAKEIWNKLSYVYPSESAKEWEIYSSWASLNPFDYDMKYSPLKPPFSFFVESPFKPETKSSTIVSSLDDFETHFYDTWKNYIDKQSFPWKDEKCIIAGGAVLKSMSAIPLGEFETKLGHISDLDIYVMNDDVVYANRIIEHVQNQFRKQLPNERFFWIEQPRLLSLYIQGEKRVQIILYQGNDPLECVSKFDLDYVQCYFVGGVKKVVCTPSCLKAWKTRHVTEFGSIQTHSGLLYKALAKGFSLSHPHRKELPTCSLFSSEMFYLEWNKIQGKFSKKPIPFYQSMFENKKTKISFEYTEPHIQDAYAYINIHPYIRNLESYHDDYYNMQSMHDVKCENNLNLVPFYIHKNGLFNSKTRNNSGWYNEAKKSEPIYIWTPPLKWEQRNSYYYLICEKTHFFYSTFYTFIKELEKQGINLDHKMDEKESICIQLDSHILAIQNLIKNKDKIQVKISLLLKDSKNNNKTQTLISQYHTHPE